MTACSFPLAVLRAREILHGAESTFGQPSCNNAQVSADRATQFPHAKSFASRPGNSLNKIKRNHGAESGPLIQSQGKTQKWGTRRPLLEVRTVCPYGNPRLTVAFWVCTFAEKMEGPLQGLFSDFQWLAFACPMNRNPA